MGRPGRIARWLALIGGLWMLANGGLSYNFAIYSSALKEALQYRQAEVDLLGTAKDIGDNVGLLAGFLSAFLPPWALLVIGAAQNSIGYGFLYLMATHRIAKPPFWKVFFVMWLGVNGSTYFNTAALVTCVRSFPKSRGVVVGLLKGLVGLSGAIYAQLYTALLAPRQVEFLEAVAIGPSVVALMVLAVLRPVPPDTSSDPLDEVEETAHLRFLVAVFLSLAVYLMVDILLGSFVPLSKTESQGVAIGMILIISLTLLVPIRVYCRRLRRRKRAGEGEGEGEESSLLGVGVGFGVPRSLSPGLSVRPGEIEGREVGEGSERGETREEREEKEGEGLEALENQETLKIGKEESDDSRTKEFSMFGVSGLDRVARCEGGVASIREQEAEEESSARAGDEGEGESGEAREEGRVEERENGREVVVKMERRPRRGEDFTLFQGLVKADFWLLFLSIVCGAGSGLTAINNLAQMGEAQGVVDMKVPVALASIWNYLGRLLGGFYSEHVVRHHGLPRPVILAGAQIVMAVGHLLFAFAIPGSLHVGSLIVGSCYGTTMAMIPAIASELFGLLNFGLFYNVFTTAVPVGSYLFSGLLAGYIYDKEAEKDGSSGGGPSLGFKALGFRSLRSMETLEVLNPVSGSGSGVPPSPGPPVCHGAHCFQLTFILMACVCMVGTLSSVTLFLRTRPVYARLYGAARKS